MVLLMSPQNARLVEALIAFFLLVYCLLVFTGRIKVKTRGDFLERNRKWLVIVAWIGLLYPIYEILSIVFHWD